MFIETNLTFNVKTQQFWAEEYNSSARIVSGHVKCSVKVARKVG